MYDQQSKAELIYWTRWAIPVIFIAYSLFNISEVYRNLYIGCGYVGYAIIIEFLGLVFTVVCGWFLGFYKGYGFNGILISMNLTMFVVIGMYHGFFYFGKDFKKYWQEINNDSHYKTHSGEIYLQFKNKHEEPQNSGNQEEPKQSSERVHEELQNSKNLENENLKSYKNYICWTTTFGLLN